MFERFTDRARRVVVQAQVEARELQHNYIGTEHVLLGLISLDEGLAVHVLRSLNVDTQALAEQVREQVGRGKSTPPVGQHIPFTPRAKKTLELSLREALQLKHDYIGTEHLLLGILHEGEGTAAEVLISRGVDLDTARAQVRKLLAERSPAATVRLGGPTRLSRVHVSMPQADLAFQLGAINRRLAAIEAKLGIDHSATEKRMLDLEAALTRARSEKIAALDAEDLEAAARHREEERRLSGLLRETQASWLEEDGEDTEQE
jgi:ATP-dependent Clp protease ATP-binding subunit ClpA